MAVRDYIIASLVEAIESLNRRVAQLAADRPEAGPPGEQGPPGQDGRDAPPVSEADIKAAVVAWLEANITQPADGAPGADGQDGEPGRPPTAAEISLAVDVWLELNRETLRGPAGRDGTDGQDGRDGQNGQAGRQGERGPKGDDGVGIDSIEQRKAGQFTVTLTDGRSFDLKLPVPMGGGGGGGGIRSVISSDGSVSVTVTENVVNLSVPATGSTGTVVATVRNSTGATIPKGAAVYISGAIGQTSTVSLALAASDETSAQTLGLTAAAIENNQTGSVIVIGYLSDVNTSAFTDGQQLYLSPTVPGGFTATKPSAPNHIVYVAVVEYAHAIHGKLFVKVQNGYELDEIHDVAISGLADGDTLQYDADADVWRNVAAVAGGGTVTSVNVSGGATGLTFSGGPVVASGTITMSGTLGTGYGGTGATTLTGYVKGTGTDALQAVAGIPASDISTPIDCGTFA